MSTKDTPANYWIAGLGQLRWVDQVWTNDGINFFNKRFILAVNADKARCEFCNKRIENEGILVDNRILSCKECTSQAKSAKNFLICDIEIIK